MVGEQSPELVPVGVPRHAAKLPHPSGLFAAISLFISLLSLFIIIIYYRLSALSALSRAAPFPGRPTHTSKRRFCFSSK